MHLSLENLILHEYYKFWDSDDMYNRIIKIL